MRLLLLPLLALPLAASAAAWDCSVTRICQGPVAALACVDLAAAPPVRLVLSEDSRAGEIGRGAEKRALAVRQHDTEWLDMTFVDRPDETGTTVLRLDLASGGLRSATLTAEGAELAEFTCKEAV